MMINNLQLYEWGRGLAAIFFVGGVYFLWQAWKMRDGQGNSFNRKVMIKGILGMLMLFSMATLLIYHYSQEPIPERIKQNEVLRNIEDDLPEISALEQDNPIGFSG
ncbi:MAG: hypothetical protein ACQEP8_01430 [Chlamydiota bacterium]